ncbi:unnamed protein product [Camellia sinensis]
MEKYIQFHHRKLSLKHGRLAPTSARQCCRHPCGDAVVRMKRLENNIWLIQESPIGPCSSKKGSRQVTRRSATDF